MSLDAHSHAVLSDYQEFPVPSQLASHFLCLWTQTIFGSQNEYAHRVLPDGCLDIVFITNAAPVFVAPWTVPLVVHLAAATQIVGARLHPGRAPGVHGSPAAKLPN